MQPIKLIQKYLSSLSSSHESTFLQHHDISEKVAGCVPLMNYGQ